MSDPPLQLPTEDLKQQREEIRRGLFRVNTALLAIVTIVVGLALAGIFAAYRASQRTLEATAATQAAQDQLWQSYLAQATAGRLSTSPGRKGQGRHIIEAASRIRPSLQLRNESIAHMALLDVASDHQEECPESNTTLVCAPDLSQYALMDGAGRLEVDRLPDRRKLLEWQAPGPDASMLMFSPGDRYLLVGYRGRGFQVLDLQTGLASPEGPRFNAVDFSADGTIVGLLIDSKTVQFLESGSGHSAHPPLSLAEPARDLAFDPGGHKLALNLGRSVQLWDWQRGEKLATLEHDRPVFSMSWSAQQLAIGDEGGGIRVWDAASLAPVTWVAHKLLVDTVLFNHRGDLLVSDSWDGCCKVWDPRTGHLLLTTTKGFGFGFSADDTRLGYAVRTSARGRWGWWQLAMPQGLRTFDCVGPRDPNIFQIDFSPDGHTLSVLGNDELRLLDLVSGQQPLVTPMKNGRSAYFLPDGHTLLTCANNRIAALPLEIGDGAGSNLHLGQPRAIATLKAQHLDSAVLSQDRRKLAFLANDTDLALLDLDAPGHQVLFPGGDKPAMPALSPDGKWFVSGTFHGQGSIVWDALTGRKIRLLDRGNSNPFFSPDSSLLVCAGDKEYRVYDSQSWRLRYSVPTGSAIDLPNCAAFSADGRVLAIVKERQFVHLIDPRQGVLLASLLAPEPQIITWLAFSPGGDSLAAATAAGLVQVWDLASIHRDLDAIGLDWKASDPGAATLATRATIANPAVVSLASARFVGPAFASVALVVFCAGFVLRRQRQLFGSYLQIDDLMERRNRELKVAQTELMHSQKMKALGTLAAGIAHDFNNLLSVIRMSNKLIGREVKGNPEVDENVAEVEKAVEQGKHIVGSMLGFSNDRQAGGQAGLFLPDLVEDTVGLLSRQFLSGITLDLELDRESPAVTLPRARLEQILLNLIVNAAEAMDGKGHLRIQVRSQAVGACQIRAPRAAPGYVELVVADTGCGIPPQILSRIFDPFFTTKAGGTNRGTGLGLSMIYTMAEQDGLGIGVETVAGKGATFRIVIPVSDAPAHDLPPETKNEPVRDWHTRHSPGTE